MSVVISHNNLGFGFTTLNWKLLDKLAPGIEYELYNFQIGETIVGSVKESAQNQS